MRFLRTMRRTSCPEIPKHELEKVLDITDREIAEKLGTSTYCVSYWRRKYGLEKLGKDLMRDVEKLLSEKCLATSHDIKRYLSNILTLGELADELSRRGYRRLIIKYRKGGGRYFRFILPSTIPRYYIYSEECEDQLVDMLASMIFKRIRIRDQRHIKIFTAIVKKYAEKNHFPEHIADKLTNKVAELLRRSYEKL
jgi:hypothetical protein